MSNVRNADHASIPSKETKDQLRGIALKGTLLGTGVGILLTTLPAISQAEVLDKVGYPNSLALKPVPIIPVDQLVDVQQTDWAYESLRSLVEKYHCIQGQSDLTFEGTRLLRRDEFASILSTCLAQIQSTFVSKAGLAPDDLGAIQHLQSDFSQELARLGDRTTALEKQENVLAAQQFSTTTQLRGEAIMAVVASNAENPDKPKDGQRFTFSDRVRLSLNTSFTGKDLLTMSLLSGNVPRLDRSSGTDMARLGFESNTQNRVQLSTLKYRFPIGDRVTIYINAKASSDESLNPWFDSSGRGSISRFGRKNPIYRQVGSTGVGIDYNPTKWMTLSVEYLADKAKDPTVGLFSRPYSALAQITIRPTRRVELGLTYLRSENSLDTGTGSKLANDPFDGTASVISANSVGLELSAKVQKHLVLGGWIGYTHAVANDLPNQPSASILNYAVTAAMPNLGRKGNLGGLIFGQPPRVIQNSLGSDFEDSQTALHIEAFYRMQITDSLSITPGVFIVTAPENGRGSIVVGTMRTTFQF
jgi:Carbohydrate-selective porin, OprB family